MGNGTKVALVALLILMVVVIARVVRNESTEGAGGSEVKSNNPQSKIAGVGAGGAAGGATAKPADATGEAGASGAAATPGARRTLQPPTAVGGALRDGAPSVVVVPKAPASPPANQAAPGVTAAGPPTVVSPAQAAPPPGGASTPPSSDASPRPAPPQHTGGLAAGAAGPETAPAPASTPGAPAAAGERPAIPPSTRLQPPRPLDSVSGQRPPAGNASGARTESLRAPLVNTELGKNGPAPGPLAGGAGPAPVPAPAPERDLPGEMARKAGAYPISYKVEKGDSFWVVAHKIYKDGALWPIIEKANPGIKVIPGNVLTVPEPPAAKVSPAPRQPVEVVRPKSASPSRGGNAAPLETEEESLSPIERIARRSTARSAPTSRQPQSLPGATGGDTEYVVKKGDTLSGLAVRFYKSAQKSSLIQDANESLKYTTLLREGARIRIPADAAR